LHGARKVDVRAKRAELVCAVESEKYANGGTSETWELIYLVCPVCLGARIGCPTTRTRETSKTNIVFPQPVRFEAQQGDRKIYLLCFTAYKDRSTGGGYPAASMKRGFA
jgi:hypothetical protein